MSRHLEKQYPREQAPRANIDFEGYEDAGLPGIVQEGLDEEAERMAQPLTPLGESENFVVAEKMARPIIEKLVRCSWTIARMRDLSPWMKQNKW